jgi:desulfoferrodoxin (superoxide reductase-like protein)
MKTSARENEDETESEDDVDKEEFDSSDSDEEPAGDTSGEDETHAAHVGHGGACEHTMSDEEFLKWIGRRRRSDETTRKNSEEEHVLKMAKESEADSKDKCLVTCRQSTDDQYAYRNDYATSNAAQRSDSERQRTQQGQEGIKTSVCL